ncbi:Mu-like prophage I protein [Methylosinus sp. sav-2]|uniref:phage protease n=1 Tax=Methylosinus sp. sav-2 TaxID=2485168 RepID=UPI00068C1AC4|nr:phage protease [Methylosinus sp. sav-2]TDX60774.1 Mu-like prophage I protein [Methylosinus sp. sav-2]
MTAHAERLASFSVVAPLPESAAEPPEWITIFPALGDVKTRDNRSYSVDGAALIRAFEASKLDIPIDINHATDNAAARGERSDAVGWISGLRIEGGALQGKVEWLDEGRNLLAKRAYRYVSPSFMHTPDGRATWVKAVSLVNAPALANQPALAAAGEPVQDQVIYRVVSTSLRQTSPAPDWVVVFPAVGFVETAGGLIFYIDAEAILEDFATATKETDEGFRQFPVNVDHRPDEAADSGKDITSPPVGEIRELRIEAGRLEARVEWTGDAENILKPGTYSATSPAFFYEASGKVKRLKSVSLVRSVRPFAKARAVGNDVSRVEADSFSARPASVENATSSFEASVRLGNLVSQTAKTLMSEHEAAGLSLTIVDALTMAATRHAPPSAGSASASHSPAATLARLDATSPEGLAQTGRKIADLASSLVAQAKRAGATLSFLDAVSQATAQLGLSSDAEGKESASPALAGGGDATAALSVRDVNARIRAANALVAEHAAAGQPLTIVQAFERLAAEASGSDARSQAQRAGEPSILDAQSIVRRANRLVAEHRAAGLSLSFVEAVERTANS